MPIFDLSNKVLLITGIGAVGEGWGNGTTMATLFARQGALVFGCDINVQAANKAADTIRNDAQAKAHPSRKEGGNIVDVMQEPIVSYDIDSTLLIHRNPTSLAGRDQILSLPKVRVRLHGKAWPNRHPHQ